MHKWLYLVRGGGREGEECEGYIYYMLPSHTESTLSPRNWLDLKWKEQIKGNYAQSKKTNKRPKSVNNVDVRTTESKTGE